LRINSAVALLSRSDSSSVEQIVQLLLSPARGEVLQVEHSQAQTLSYYSLQSKHAFSTQMQPLLEAESLEHRRRLFAMTQSLPEPFFYEIARTIVEEQQKDLIPDLVHYLESLHTSQSVALLKEMSHKPGTPFIRCYSALALFRLREPGYEIDPIINWIQLYQGEQLVHFHPIRPKGKSSHSSYELQPDETAKLLIESMQTLVQCRADQAKQTLLEALCEGHPKNRPLLAGLLLRATE
jgi:hypothetical protein